jgi:hypothetical protein
MKRIPLLSLAITLGLFYGCGQKNTDKLSTEDQMNQVLKSETYTAIYERDTAMISIIRKGAKIEGKLSFSYGSGIREAGTLKGVVKGDTLLADYHYQSQKGQWQRNPVALLKKGGLLYMGVGETKFAWGRTYFANTAAIDYEKGRFVFVKDN